MYRSGAVILMARLARRVSRRASLPTLAIAMGLLLLVAALPSPGPGGAHPSASASPPPTSPRSSGPPSTRGSSAVPADTCSGPAGGWALIYPGLAAPAAPALAVSGPCATAPDESSLSFVSSTLGTGERFSATVVLPPAGSVLAAAMSRLSMRTWVSGPPCALDAAAEVSIDLIPPLSPYLANPSLNWSVAAPVYVLAPPAACVPTCSNDSTFYTFQVAPVCEAQVALEGGSGVPIQPQSRFVPGDTLTITLAGGGAGAAPLAVWINDSTRPALGLAFQYGAAADPWGVPLVPRFTASDLGQPVWGLSSAVSIVATNCPLPSGPTGSCNSYNATLWQQLTPVRLTGFGFYNGSSGRYDLPYDRVAEVSSTGGCHATQIRCAVPLPAAYPSWSLQTGTGATAWQYGVGANGSDSPFPNASAVQPIAVAPLVHSDVALTPVGANLVIAERLTDPEGLRAVNFTVSYCAPTVLSASLGPGPANSTQDGWWTASMSYTSHKGPVPLLTTVATRAGDAPGVWAALANLTGSLATCADPPLAAPTGVNATAVAQGYLVNWSTVPTGAARVLVRAALPNGTVINQSVAPYSPQIVVLGVGGVPSNLTASAVDAAGVVGAPSTVVVAGPTLGALSVSGLRSSASSIWAGPAEPLVNITGNVSGGSGPYVLQLDFGDGASTFLGVSSSWKASHAYGSYYGLADVRGTLLDSVGDTLALPPVMVTIRATPLGVNAVATGGDGLASLSWPIPPSPTAPVASYRVFYSSQPTLSGLLAAAGASNATLPGVVVWNLTAPFLTIPAANGGVLYLQVVAVDAFGLGELPSGPPTPLVVRPAPFVLGPIVAAPGGAAPFRDNFSATATLGSNDSIVAAVYSFPDGSVVTATPTYANGTFYLNGSFVFTGPGSYVVVLHALDALFETQIDTTEVRVTTGVPPLLSATVVNGPAYAGIPVQLQASPSGGSGTFVVNWSFGDGTLGTGDAVEHSFPGSGIYTVLVTATDAQTGGATTFPLPVTVFALPVVFVSVTPGPNGSLSYDLRASIGGGSGPSAVVWSFGDGGVARGANVTHDYLNRGTYHVNVTATDPTGRTGSASFNLTANPTPSGGGTTTVALSPLDVGLLVAALVLLGLILVLGARRRRPPESTAIEPVRTEDGEVSLR